MTLAEKFAKNLKQQRIKKRLSQEELAYRACLSVSLISMWERGNRKPPLDTLEIVAKALHTRPLSLLS